MFKFDYIPYMYFCQEKTGKNFYFYFTLILHRAAVKIKTHPFPFNRQNIKISVLPFFVIIPLAKRIFV